MSDTKDKASRLLNELMSLVERCHERRTYMRAPNTEQAHEDFRQAQIKDLERLLAIRTEVLSLVP